MYSSEIGDYRILEHPFSDSVERLCTNLKVLPKKKKQTKKPRRKNKPLLFKGFKKTLIESSHLSNDFCWPVEYLTLQRRENTLNQHVR